MNIHARHDATPNHDATMSALLEQSTLEALAAEPKLPGDQLPAFGGDDHWQGPREQVRSRANGTELRAAKDASGPSNHPVHKGDVARLRWLLDQALILIARNCPSGVETELMRLRRENAELRSALEPNMSPSTPDFLDWVAERLVKRYLESPHMDFVLALRRKASKIRAALANLETKR